MMDVAPYYESCIACLNGDVATGIGFEGEAEWIAAAIASFGDMTTDEAIATLYVIAEHELGCDAGTVPFGRFTLPVRLCRECAKRSGVEVGEVARELPCYRLPD